ncbi:MAG: D-alanyl-D-alanine carboxypeptidase, partial [Gaiellales bacterium]
ARSGTYGTLRRRMTRFPYRGRVQAKTGTLRHVSALAGFSERSATGRRYGFAVVTSQPRGAPISYTAARSLQDRIAMVLVR